MTEKVVVGRFGAPHGVRGAVKLQSFTEHPEDLFNYGELFLKKGRQWQPIEIEDAKFQGKHFVATVKGVADRDAAALLTNLELAVERSAMPEAQDDEIYWHDLIGLTAVSCFEGQSVNLGVVDHVMETGANDVLSLKPSKESVDSKHRLVPYIDSVVTEVDIEGSKVVVDWDPEF
jgi:16S rRNA processing protein RimM